MRRALAGERELLTREDLPESDRGPRTLDLPLSSNPVWYMLRLFLTGGRYDRSTNEERRRV